MLETNSQAKGLMETQTENGDKPKATGSIGWFVTVAVLLFKYKVFVISLIISLGLYIVTFGWRFAVTLIVLIYIHEMGHFAWMKLRGLNPSAPVFVPFLGAYVAMDSLPKDKFIQAQVAFAGPLIGGLAALLLYQYALSLQSHYLIAAANYGLLLNLFQLVPAKPFDGGFVVESVWQWLLIPGAISAGVFGWYIHSPILVMIAILGLFQQRAAATAAIQEASGQQKILVSLAYVGLIALLVFYYLQSDIVLNAMKATL